MSDRESLRRSSCHFRRRRRTTRPAIAALLREAELPHEDFAGHLAHFLVVRQAGEVVGAVGFELHGRDALLRSLVVAPALRGAGLGGRLVRRLDAPGAVRGGAAVLSAHDHGRGVFRAARVSPDRRAGRAGGHRRHPGIQQPVPGSARSA